MEYERAFDIYKGIEPKPNPQPIIQKPKQRTLEDQVAASSASKPKSTAQTTTVPPSTSYTPPTPSYTSPRTSKPQSRPSQSASDGLNEDYLNIGGAVMDYLTRNTNHAAVKNVAKTVGAYIIHGILSEQSNK